MSRAMHVTGFTTKPPKDTAKRDDAAISLSYPRAKGIVDANEEDTCDGVIIEIAKLDPSIKFLRIIYS